MNIFLSRRVMVLLSALMGAFFSASASGFDFEAFWREPPVAEVPFDEVVLDEGDEDGIRWRQFVYTSMLHDGKPVRVFAVYAAPADLDPGEKRPALVATHGLFGRASLETIKPYAIKGYPVLMWEWEIRYTPSKIKVPEDGMVSLPHTYYPQTLYPDRKYPRADPEDWKRTIWHPAITAGRRAITWLQGRPGVDPDRIGAFGGSYGGQACSLLATVDPRIRAVFSFSFAPLSLESPSGLLSLPDLSPVQKKEYAARFDAAENLKRTRAAFYWQVGTHDRPFFPPAIHKTFAQTPAPRALWLLPNNDHIHPSEAAALAWFETHLRGGTPFPEPGTPAASVAKDAVTVRVAPVAPRAEQPLTHVTVFWSDLVPDPDYVTALWRAAPARPAENGEWSATLIPPFGGTDRGIRIFATARDVRGAIVSTSPFLDLDLAGYDPPPPDGTAPAVDGTISIARFKKNPPLDGSLAGWPDDAWTPPFTLQFVSGQSAAKPEPATSTLGDMDARFAAGWTPGHFLFAFRVHSPFPLVNAAPEEPFWHGDSFQIRILAGPGAAADSSPGKEDTVLHIGGWRGANGKAVLDGQAAINGKPASGITDWGDAALNLKEMPDGKGWTAEGRIPWSVMNIAPARGVKLRMGLQVNIGNEVGDMSLGYCEFNNGQNFGTPAKWGTALFE